MKNIEEFSKEELIKLVNEQNLELSTRLKHIHSLLNSLKNKDIQIEKLKIDLIEKDIDIENLSDQLAVLQEQREVILVENDNIFLNSTIDISGNLENNNGDL